MSESTLVFDSTRPLTPFSAVQESDLISDSQCLTPLFYQILTQADIQLVYREFAMQMIRAGVSFTFVLSQSGLKQKLGASENIPLIQDGHPMPKLMIPVQVIVKKESIKNILGNIYVYLVNTGSGQYSVGARMRINLQRLPSFDDDAFGAFFIPS
jgi:hypothetical protein